MNILVVSSYLPYPLFSGGHIRLYNIIKGLSKHHTITLVCERRKHQTKKDEQALKEFCKEVIVFDRKKQWSLPTILKTGFSSYPFLMAGHTLPEMKEGIEELLSKNTFDLIHIETFYIMQNLPKTHTPIVLVEHNIEYLVYKRYVATAPIHLRSLYVLDVVKLAYWEKKYWKKADALVAVSEQEKAEMERKDTFVVPNGVDTTLYNPKYKPKSKKKIKRILFIGDFKWIQNSDAVMFLLTTIWPKIIELAKQKNIAKPQLWIVGKSIPATIRRATDGSSVVFDEHAPDDTSLIYRVADVLLAPIRVGGGTSYKILEAMASGVPVVTTGLGAEGIAAQDGKDILIAEDSEDLAKQTVALLSGPVLYDKIAANARKVVEKNYDWKIIVEKLEAVYNGVVTQ